jgi:hypothetical protein
LAKEMMNLAFEMSLFILRSDFLHAVKSYDMRPAAFLPPPPEGRRAADFIAVKHPSPPPGLNPRTLNLMASTLTITPSRRLS